MRQISFKSTRNAASVEAPVHPRAVTLATLTASKVGEPDRAPAPGPRRRCLNEGGHKLLR